MLEIKLAMKNLLGAGLRTWLNAGVLSFAFVIIIFYNGLLDGWNEQAKKDTIEWEAGTGQLWHPKFDTYDPLSFQDAHGEISANFQNQIKSGHLTPILYSQATIYPGGRIQNVILKGIQREQKLLKIPSSALKSESGELPAIIGKRMATSSGLKKGDKLIVRWRDKNGTFDARELVVTEVFNTNVPTVDMGQVWLPLDSLQSMTGLSNESSIFIVGTNFINTDAGKWKFIKLETLLKDLDDVIKYKKTSGRILQLLLLSIALLAIFDTQVLSIFRRQKEIGTYIAFGMTRREVVGVFTIEGGFHSIFALLLALIYGVPLLYLLHATGIPMPKPAGDMGMSIAEKIIPVYSLGLVISTTLLVVISATIVSYFPARRISGMNPTDALKGKIQ